MQARELLDGSRMQAPPAARPVVHLATIKRMANWLGALELSKHFGALRSL